MSKPKCVHRQSCWRQPSLPPPKDTTTKIHALRSRSCPQFSSVSARVGQRSAKRRTARAARRAWHAPGSCGSPIVDARATPPSLGGDAHARGAGRVLSPPPRQRGRQGSVPRRRACTRAASLHKHCSETPIGADPPIQLPLPRSLGRAWRSFRGSHRGDGVHMAP